METPDPAAVVAELVAALPAGAVVTDRDVIDGFRADRAQVGEPGWPLAVVRAAGTGDVVAALRVAGAHGVPVVPRGAGTGLSGGASAVDGCITLSTELMRTIEIDAAAMVAEVGPGALNVDVKSAAIEHGLWYPPDPSSFETCSIGGNVATNAGGLCCAKYGVTGDYVLGLEVVLADATVLQLGGRTIKDVAGYDLKRLFIGSEGTLGVVTGVTLRLVAAPGPAHTVVAAFAEVVAAGRAVVQIVRTLRPAMLELMDGTALVAVEAMTKMGFDPSWGAMLLARSDAPGQQGADEAGEIERLCVAAGATYAYATGDPDEGESLMAARRMALPALEELGTAVIEDVGVPVPRIPELLTGITAISARTGCLIPVVGHAADGNFHPLIVFDEHDPDAVARAETAFDDVMALAIGLGGTITGEHGVGTLKAPWLDRQLGEGIISLSHAIKHALDPQGILNPGKVLQAKRASQS